MIRTVPIEVLGGGVIVMFGMVVAAGISMLSDVAWNRRNMVIFAVSLSVGLGLQLESGSLQHVPETLRVLLASGLLPAKWKLSPRPDHVPAWDSLSEEERRRVRSEPCTVAETKPIPRTKRCARDSSDPSRAEIHN